MDAAVRIGELARRTGVSPELLRAWEQRYNLLQPGRSAGGFRLYSAADEARVRRMTGNLRRGLSAAEAARLALLGDEELAVASAPLDDVTEALRSALDAFDTAGAHRALDRLLSVVSVDVAVADVLIPYLRDLGRRWQTGDASVAQEHFASNLIRGRLLGVARDVGAGEGPRAILACLPSEAHDLGLVMFGVLLARRGWSVIFLGANTPFDTLHDSVRWVHPDIVVLTTLDAEVFRANVEPLRELAAMTTVTVVAPVPDAEVEATGARPAASDIVETARTLHP